MDLIDHLQLLKQRAEQAGASLTNEEATKMALIAPFIQALGYDIFNPEEVKPEYSADLQGIKQGERVDYAVLEDNQPKILVEAKAYNVELRTAEKGQLMRYFQATKARIGILTNGKTFLFFSDLEDMNIMDEKPFAEINLFDLKAAPLEQIKQMSKSQFDLDQLLSTAERLKYLRAVKNALKEEFSTPSDWLVKEMLTQCHSAKRVSQSLIEEFRPVVVEALKAVVADQINARLSSAMEAGDTDGEPDEIEVDEEGDGLEFTEQEREGLYITRAICSEIVDGSRIVEKDAKRYCNIQLDGKYQGTFVRMWFNAGTLRLEIFDDVEPAKVSLEAVGDIYKYSERIKVALQKKLAG